MNSTQLFKITGIVLISRFNTEFRQPPSINYLGFGISLIGTCNISEKFNMINNIIYVMKL